MHKIINNKTTGTNMTPDATTTTGDNGHDRMFRCNRALLTTG